MNTLRFMESQIMTILKQNKPGTSVPDLCGEHGISSISLYIGELNLVVRTAKPPQNSSKLYGLYKIFFDYWL